MPAKRPPELLLRRPFVYMQTGALVVLGQAFDVVGDHVFLVGGDDHDRDGGTGGTDDLRAVAHGLTVLVIVDAHAQPLKAVAEGLRIDQSFSPMPAVKVMVSTPAIEAIMEPACCMAL